MSDDLKPMIQEICGKYGNDRTRMMDIVRDVQERAGYVSDEAMDAIAEAVETHRVEVESQVSFYAFLSRKPKGKVVIRLCDDIVDRISGFDRVATAFSDALGIGVGETTPDGKITLEETPCIGMCDQAPAALVNDVVFTNLSRDDAFEIVEQLQHDTAPEQIVRRLGDGNNAHELVRSMVFNNVRRTGPVIFAEMNDGEAVAKALAMSPAEVIRDVKTARLRGRGGAGFPTGMKWDFTRSAKGDRRYVLCNADEGEPGTFKDRVILTEKPDLLVEGMTIAGYALGADTGIIYLRAEYAYLRAFLEDVLAERRNRNLLGKAICGKAGFDFDIRIQMGAGAYVCGEETAMISSCEGLRGDPKNRPPFPAQKGYLAQPTVVNNVETFCCVARILEKGPGWFAQMGSSGSAGTKLLSVSGDCQSPGIYEVPFGTKLREVLDMVGARDAKAVQVGGPSGQLVAENQFDRAICYDDLATGGSIVVFGKSRDVLAIADYYMDFFIEESCGYCTPCRVGNVLLKKRLEKLMHGKGEPADLDYLVDLGTKVKAASRCGLGQTSPNPILTSIKNFPDEYAKHVEEETQGFVPTFILSEAVSQAEGLAGRKSVHL